MHSGYEKPRCERRTLRGEPCKGAATTRDDAGRLVCRVHAGLLGDPAEMGRRSAKARKAKRAKRGGKEAVREAVSRRLEADPDGFVDRLMSSAKGVEVLWMIGYAEEPTKPKGEAGDTAAPIPAGHKPVTWEDMLEVLRRTQQVHLLATYPRACAQPMLELLEPDELAQAIAWKAARAEEGDAVQESDRSHVPASTRLVSPLPPPLEPLESLDPRDLPTHDQGEAA